MDPDQVIEVDAIRKAYGPTVAADDVSFTVRCGEIFGLIGPNGAGKTTTMECVEGLRAPDAGRIQVLGLDPVRDRRALQLRIGVQLQEAQLQKRIKVWEAVAFWQALYPTAVDGGQLLRRLGLHDKRNAWFMTLSGGQKQRLFIALALVNDPEVVFLDELTTGLDPQARRAIWELVRGIRDRGKTVFLTTHLMEEAERLCDRVAILDHGRIIDIDRPAALVERHCPQRTVVVATDFPTAAERFRAVPSATTVSSEGGRLTMLSIGFVIASVVPTARFAQPLGALLLYPMIPLSGLFTPIETLPPGLETVARFLPLTYAVSLLRGIWSGNPWSAHVGDVAALGLIFVLAIAVASRVFRWE